MITKRILITAFIFNSLTLVYSQNLQKQVFSVASNTFYSNSTQTIGLPLATKSFSTKHFYGFEQPFKLPTITEDLTIKLYPIPFISLFTIQYSRPIASYEIKIFDLDSKSYPIEVFQQGNELVVQVNRIQNGVYLASIVINNKHFLKKIIKN